MYINRGFFPWDELARSEPYTLKLSLAISEFMRYLCMFFILLPFEKPEKHDCHHWHAVETGPCRAEYCSSCLSLSIRLARCVPAALLSQHWEGKWISSAGPIWGIALWHRHSSEVSYKASWSQTLLSINCPAKKGLVKQRFGEIIPYFPFVGELHCIQHSRRSCLFSRFQFKGVSAFRGQAGLLPEQIFIFHSRYSSIKCLCTDKMCICLYP